MSRHDQINLTSLRERAEQAIAQSESEMLFSPADAKTIETHHLLEELSVYQAELEIQNLELSTAQAKIALSLEKYRNLYEHLPLPAAVIDAHGFIVDTNLIADEWLGIRRNGLLQRRSIALFFEHQGRSEIYRVLCQGENLAQQVIERMPFRLANGQRVTCDVHLTHLHDESDGLGRTLLLLVNRSAEIALQKSEAFKDAILDSMPAQIAVLDSNGTIVSVNRSWLDFAANNGGSGDANQHIGVSYLNCCQPRPHVLPDEGSLEAFYGIGSVLQRSLPSFRVDYPCHSPTENRWFSLSATPINTDCGHVVITHTNITESKLAEMAVRESHETLLGILKTTRDGFWQIDTRGTLINVNATYCQLSGYAREELLGTNIDGLEAIADRGEIERQIKLIMESGSDQFETRHRRKDGSFWDVEISVTYHAAAGGQLLVFLRDISDRKKVTSELNAALKAAKIADQSKDAFFANVTHELRTPLSAVIGFSSLARPLSTNPKQCDYLDKVNNAGKTLAGIIDDLLDLSKIASGHLEFESKAFSLRKLVQRCLSVLSFEAEKKGLALTGRVDDALPDVLVGDALRVEQILLNLLSNAVKFTQVGRVELRIRQQDREVQRVCVEIAVEDTGIGLSAEEIGYLFKPFSQAGVFISRQFGGTGLGLSICKQLAEAMSGDITVLSEPGIGTTFLVKLWLGRASDEVLPEEQLPAQQAKKLLYQGARVLVVDDQTMNREVVEGLMAVVGIKPVLACNGHEAIDILQATPEDFDLVLMDVQMPVMDGLSATRLIRQIGRFVDLPVIAITAHAMAHELERGQAAGMNGHLSKPFDEDAFYGVLAHWIPKAKQLQAPVALELQPREAEFPALAGVDTNAGLSLLLGNEGRYRQWLTEFVSEGPAASHKIGQALLAGGFETANMAAHTLRGRAGILGMQNLCRLAGELETAIERGAPTEVLLDDLQQEMARVCLAIENGLGIAPTPLAVESGLGRIPSGPLPPAIVQLISSLQAGDGDCDDFVADCLAKFDGTPWAPRLYQARSLIQKFDFAAASKLFLETQ